MKRASTPIVKSCFIESHKETNDENHDATTENPIIGTTHDSTYIVQDGDTLAGIALK
jgi:hypothetical protein